MTLLIALAFTPSIVKPADMDPTCTPADREILLLGDSPWLLRHEVDESDIQRVSSHAVTTTFICCVSDHRPVPMPCKVKAAEPVWPRLEPCAVLKARASDECAAVAVLIVTPTVKSKRELLGVVIADLPVKHVSDIHFVPSHTVCPMYGDDVMTAPPTPDPNTVTLDEPVAAIFGREAALSRPLPS